MSEDKSETLGRCNSRVCNRSIERWIHTYAGWCEGWAPLPSSEGTVKPTLEELLAAAKDYVMTPEEIEAQRQSWVRGEMPHGIQVESEGRCPFVGD